MLGLFSDFSPRFVKRFADGGAMMRAAFEKFDTEVKAGVFPNNETHAFGGSEELLLSAYTNQPFGTVWNRLGFCQEIH